MTLTSESPVAAASDSPCLACPWGTANRSRPTPGGWYSRRNLDRLWSGLRRGARMSCHPTDPRMADVVEDGYAGFSPASRRHLTVPAPASAPARSSWCNASS